MTTFKKILFVLCILLVGVSCQRSEILESLETPLDSADNCVRFSVELPNSIDVAAVTRADGTREDIVINYGYVFFFSADGVLLGDYFVDKDIVENNATENPYFLIDAEGYSNSCKLICVFNFDKTTAKSDFSGLTKDNVSDYFPMNAAFIKKVQDSHNAVSGYEGTQYDVGMPMFVNDFTDVNNSTHEIYRAVARMSIAMASGLIIPHETHEHPIEPGDIKYAIVNQASVGDIGFTKFGEANYATSKSDVVYNGTDELEFPYTLSTYIEGEESGDVPKNYLFEYPYSTLAVDASELDEDAFDPKRMAIILQHHDDYSNSYLYYKLNLVDKIKGEYFDVERNHDYRIIIKAVYSRGYESLEEAYLMPPSNIEYEIYDDNGETTYSNGQYAISMDEILNYDVVQIYGHNSTIISFSNIRYIIPDQMSGIDVEDLTNSVDFEIISEVDNSVEDWVEDNNFKVDVLQNDFENDKVLTSQSRSIILELSGEGTCTLKLKIKLGNLEVGRDEITINKLAPNGDGDGAFDAHPGYVELAGQQFVENSWQSDDIDFGARSTQTEYDEIPNRTIVYLGENATPTGYKTMDGFVSGQHSKNSYPVFSPKTRTGYYSYVDTVTNKTLKTMIQIEQLAPFYLGHFGMTATDESSLYHYNALICEKIEEIPTKDWSGAVISKTNGLMSWSQTSGQFYTGTIWGDYLGLGERFLNLVEGRSISQNIVENNTSEGGLPLAARYCYMKNDINANGIIEDNEPIVWYLPAQNQLLSMWINMNVFDTDLDLYKLNNTVGRDDRPYYWTCSEAADVYDYTYTIPTDFTQKVNVLNVLEGQSLYFTKDVSVYESCHIRCVRGLD